VCVFLFFFLRMTIAFVSLFDLFFWWFPKPSYRGLIFHQFRSMLKLHNRNRRWITCKIWTRSSVMKFHHKKSLLSSITSKNFMKFIFVQSDLFIIYVVLRNFKAWTRFWVCTQRLKFCIVMDRFLETRSTRSLFNSHWAFRR